MLQGIQTKFIMNNAPEDLRMELRKFSGKRGCILKFMRYNSSTIEVFTKGNVMDWDTYWKKLIEQKS